ncbi:uncharacterized protein ARMOST_13572 [Armillaria ostoyae]|uniref:Uncharacterized protein n=1 Tax=Armillaria ostoyae TaxID=47428 RepID=A0A284RN68_ARMOS|nr:uncharacterized protein ARMOST_13572 [Armillaria ostoyae]
MNYTGAFLFKFAFPRLFYGIFSSTCSGSCSYQVLRSRDFSIAWMIAVVRRRRDSFGSVQGQYPCENGLDRDLLPLFANTSHNASGVFPLHYLIQKCRLNAPHSIQVKQQRYRAASKEGARN